MGFETEFFDAGGDADLVAVGGEGFHEQAVGFVATSEGGEVERIMGEENPHASWVTGRMFMLTQAVADLENLGHFHGACRSGLQYTWRL